VKSVRSQADIMATEVFQDWDNPHDKVSSITRKTTRKTTKTTTRREVYEDSDEDEVN
jgi:hypothetical protein